MLLRSGFFYQISDNTWHQKKYPPHIMIRGLADPNAMYSWRGRPTIFGSPMCDEEVNCEYKEINQYMSGRNEWVKIGEMNQPRVTHEVIEIPPELCNTGTATTAAPIMTDAPTTMAPQDYDTVALIIGGTQAGSGGEPMASAEFFGCPDLGDDLVEMPDFPVGVYLSAGVYYPDGNKVIVCGGNQCTEPRVCSASSACYEWLPGSSMWKQSENGLNDVKWGHFMGLTTNLDDTSSTAEVPIVLGYGTPTEIYDPDTETWGPYRPLEDPNWTSLACLLQAGNSIWQMRSTLFELNMDTWQLIDHGPIPERLINPGRCALAEIDGVTGKNVPKGK